MTKLSGIFPVLCTPFDNAGLVDEESLRRLVDFEVAAGADGIVVGGVASEVYKLSESERSHILETVMEQVGARVPVIVGAWGESTHLAVAMAHRAKDSGATAVMVMPPMAVKHGPGALLGHFAAIGEVGIPIMVQDHPGLTGVQMPAAFLADLVNKIPAAEYLKVEAPPTGPKGSDVLRLTGSAVTLFGGLGGQNFVEELQRGFVGTLPGASIPEVYIAIQSAYRSGNVAEAKALHNRFVPIMRFISQSVEFSFHAYKEILRRRGVIATAYVRRPTSSFDEVNQAELTDLLHAVDLDGLVARA